MTPQELKKLINTYEVRDLDDHHRARSLDLASTFCNPDAPIEDRLAARSNYVLDYGPLDASMKLMADASREIRRLKGDA